MLVIVAGGRRLRFEPMTVFPHGRGLLPDEVAATLDIGDYLSGKKEPPGVEWWPDNPAPAAGE